MQNDPDVVLGDRRRDTLSQVSGGAKQADAHHNTSRSTRSGTSLTNHIPTIPRWESPQRIRLVVTDGFRRAFR